VFLTTAHLSTITRLTIMHECLGTQATKVRGWFFEFVRTAYNGSSAAKEGWVKRQAQKFVTRHVWSVLGV